MIHCIIYRYDLSRNNYEQKLSYHKHSICGDTSGCEIDTAACLDNSNNENLRCRIDPSFSCNSGGVSLSALPYEQKLSQHKHAICDDTSGFEMSTSTSLADIIDKK